MDEDRALEAGLGLELGEQAIDVVDVPRPLDLGDHDDLEAVADLAHELGDVVEHPRRLERVDARPQRRRAEVHLAPDPDEPLARGLLAVDRDRVLEVAEQDVGLRRDVGGLGHHLLVGEVQEVDHPRGPQRDLGQRGGRADGQRLEEVAGVAHGRDDIDSPVNLRWYPYGHAPGRARCARRRLSQSPRPPRPTGSALSRAGPVRRRRRPGALRRAPRPAARAAPRARRPDRPRLRGRRAAAPPAQARASSRSWPSSTAARAARRRPTRPDPAQHAAVARHARADASAQATNVLAPRRPTRPAACAPRGAEGRRPALRPARRRAAAGLRRALDDRPGAGRRLRAPGRPRLPRGRSPRRRCQLPPPKPPPCPPCPPFPPAQPAKAAIVCPTPQPPAACPEPA